MPERLANTPPGTRITEMVGSGPFRFLPDERVSGARNAYAKFEKYRPRDGVASFCAGPRIANFDRVEWLTTPDPATQAAALKAGEVDWVEQPVMDLVPSLKADRNLRVEVVETTGLIGVLRFNHLHPPFDNPAIRRAALRAVDQREFMTAVAGEAGPEVINDHVGFFAPSSPYASDAGMENVSPNPDLGALRQTVDGGRLQRRESRLPGRRRRAAHHRDLPGRCRLADQDRTERGLRILGLGHRRAAHLPQEPDSRRRLEHLRLHVGRLRLGQSRRRPGAARQRRERLVRLARQPEAGGDPRPVAARDRPADAEGACRRHAAPGLVDAPCMPLGSTTSRWPTEPT